MERLTEHLGNSIFIRGCKTFYANEERKNAPASNAIVRLAAYEDTMTLERAQELAKAEKEGQLVVLPCKPDANAYRWKNGDDIASLFRFDGVIINDDGEIIYKTRYGETFTLDDFGKIVFLNYEEAKKSHDSGVQNDEVD